jgi:hypothetical protein
VEQDPAGEEKGRAKSKIPEEGPGKKGSKVKS